MRSMTCSNTAAEPGVRGCCACHALLPTLIKCTRAHGFDLAVLDCRTSARQAAQQGPIGAAAAQYCPEQASSAPAGPLHSPARCWDLPCWCEQPRCAFQGSTSCNKRPPEGCAGPCRACPAQPSMACKKQAEVLPAGQLKCFTCQMLHEDGHLLCRTSQYAHHCSCRALQQPSYSSLTPLTAQAD